MESQLIIGTMPKDVDFSRAKSFFPDANGAIEWRERLNRADKVFYPGETIAVHVDIEHWPQTGPFFKVSDASCNTDRFNPVGLSDFDQGRLVQLIGFKATVLLTITECGDRYICSGNQYTVEPRIELVTMPVNPSQAEMQAMPVGTDVVIEGRVVDLSEWERAKTVTWSDTGVMIAIVGDNGMYLVRSKLSKIRYDNGVLENLRSKEARVGETIRIIAQTTGETELDGEYNNAYLLIPDDKRKAEYDDLRNLVSIGLQSLQVIVDRGIPGNARNVFAMLREFELTAHETEQMESIVGGLPESEQPIYGRFRDDALALKKQYGPNIETMNKREFLNFAKDVATGRFHCITREKTHSSAALYNILEKPPFAEGEYYGIVMDTINHTRYRISHGNYDKDSASDLYVELGVAVERLHKIGSATAFDELLSLGGFLVANGYFDRESGENTYPEPYRGVLNGVLLALHYIVYEKPQLRSAYMYMFEHWENTLFSNQASYYVQCDIRRLTKPDSVTF